MKQTLLLFFVLNTVFSFAQAGKENTLPFNANYVASNVSIPNVFTPNGDDINDVFKIDNVGLASISCKIYSRWGVLVAELDAPNQVWDGYTPSGVLCSPGTYFYVFTAKGIDDATYNLKGFIQLVR